MNQKMRENEVCFACEYVITNVLDGGPPFECDPPTGECPLDRPQDEYPEDLPDILSYANTGIARPNS